ncbi:LAME_0G05270g1_1 [Lachancea meyersii CBS 8951]|uniref:LAME_0G05270g1_1 n=1 Tax=Lachancea meyersii CBS 8951 TaxID=1266667 RepID=A0A1G4K767_9SACH|nr:LAME_0G05270g1_1 [Lachancea meyersii CBS 8951]
MIVIKLLIWLLQGCRIVQTAGVAVHLTLLARTGVPSGLQPYLAELKAGTFFPDAFYSCTTNQKWQEFSEWAHWPPFLILGAQIWRERYENNKNCENALKLKAFLLGVFVHQITDVSWHSLVSGYRSHGLVRALADLEFDGDYESAHNFIDSMGDFLMLGQIITDYAVDSWDYYTDQDWNFPTEHDLLELIRRSGVTDMHFWEVNTCVRRGAAALASEVISLVERRKPVLEIGYDVSPRARELIQDHWLGGEMNSIAMVNKCLPIFLSLFENNNEFSDAELETLIELCGSLPTARNAASAKSVSVQVHNQQDGTLFLSPLTSLSLFGSDIAIGKFRNNLTSLAISAPLEENEGTVYVIPWHELNGLETAASTEKPVSTAYGTRVHAYPFEGVDYLVVSAPGENSVHFYDNGQKILTLTDNKSWERHQLSVSLIQDIDGDNIPDLILGGPHYGLNETGVVLIVEGREVSRLLRDPEVHDMELHELSTLSLKAPLSATFQNFGSQIVVSSGHDKGALLYVTAQGLGVIFVYSLQSLRQNALPRYYITDDVVIRLEEDIPLDLSIRKSSIHGMFGKELETWRFENRGFIGVSCHLQNKVYLYKESFGRLRHYATLVLDTSMDPKTVNAAIEFGASIQYDDTENRIFISSPGIFEGTGAIWGIKMLEIQQSVEKWKLTTILVTPARHLVSLNKGTSGKGIPDFGKIIKMGPEGRLIVGAPRYGYGDFGHYQLSGSVVII